MFCGKTSLGDGKNIPQLGDEKNIPQLGDGKNMGSAHPLVEVNVSFKFEENPSISKGVIERTRHNV